MPRRSGMIEAGADTFAGQIPTILKLNSSNSLVPTARFDQAVTALGRRRAAARLRGDRLHHLSRLGGRARHVRGDLASCARRPRPRASPTVIWSYPRGERHLEGRRDRDRRRRLRRADRGAARRAHHQGQALDRPPRAGRGEEGLREAGDRRGDPGGAGAHCMQAAFAGRRIVVFSGGAAKGEDAVYEDARAIRDGGGNGSIIGRNTFQRPREDALAMLDKLVEIYKGRVTEKGAISAIKGIPFARAIWHARPQEHQTGIAGSNVSRSRAAPRHVRGGLRPRRGGAHGLPELCRAPGRAWAAQPLPRRGAGVAPEGGARQRSRPSGRPSPTRPSGSRAGISTSTSSTNRRARSWASDGRTKSSSAETLGYPVARRFRGFTQR